MVVHVLEVHSFLLASPRRAGYNQCSRSPCGLSTATGKQGVEGVHMLYRKLGKTGLEVSILGFGAMRLPIVGGIRQSIEAFDPAKVVDEKEAVRMIRYAVEKGINYFDTAFIYHMGHSEVILGKGLKDFRDKVAIATKLPLMVIQDSSDFQKTFDKQLERLGTDYIDIYLAHGLNRHHWNRLREMGMLEFMERVKSEGRARHIGFSFHDDAQMFKEIVDSHDWELCQIQYNYFDEDYQAGRTGLEYAASKGLGVVIMEPIRGGKLADPVPAKVRALWNTAAVKRSAAEWALRWVWNYPEVSLLLSGMSNMEQLMENIRIAEEGRPGSLTREELALIDKVKVVYREAVQVGCTGCGYCMPCEQGVNIPEIFSMYNDQYIFGDKDLSSVFYGTFLTPEQQASSCTECGACEEKCPQQIPIRDELKKAHESLYHPELLPQPPH